MTDTVYTKDVVADVVARYEAVVGETYETRTAVVKELADEYGVSVASMRSKLVNERVYKAKEKAESDTSGTSKDEYVKALSAIVGVELKSMTKATKADLKAVVDYITVASAQRDADNGVVERTS
jgi:hypothetical protein